MLNEHLKIISKELNEYNLKQYTLSKEKKKQERTPQQEKPKWTYLLEMLFNDDCTMEELNEAIKILQTKKQPRPVHVFQKFYNP